MPWARAAEERRDPLGPLVGSVERPCPRHGEVVIGEPGAPGVIELHLIGDRQFDPVELQDLARHAIGRAFGRSAVVTANIDDQRVVEFAHVLDRLDHPADFMVGVGQIRGIDDRLKDVELLLFVGGLIPELQCRTRA